MGVVQREHVHRGLAMGIAQTNHGAAAGLRRMEPGDRLVYYSPKTAYPEGDALKEFTAIGVVADGVPWQSPEAMWRRRVDYVEGVRSVPIAELAGELELTSKPNWGYALRRGLLELTAHDFALVAAAMGASELVPADQPLASPPMSPAPGAPSADR